MTTERAQELQVRITKEALALMVIHGESVSTAPSEEDVSVAHFEEAVTLIGKAWNLPAGDTTESLDLIEREKDVLRRIAAGESASHVLPESELPMNATGMEKLASELAECQNLLDWIEKTAAERKLPEIAAG